MFNASGNAFVGAEVCALDRTSMLAGAAATQQCTVPNPLFGGLLGASLDGTRPPPTGSPEYVVALGVTDPTGAASTLATCNFPLAQPNTFNTPFTDQPTL